MQKRTKNTSANYFFIRRLFAFSLILISFVPFTACSKDDDPSPNPVKKQGIPVSITVNPGERYQTIAGFGGANKIWGNQFLDDDVIKKVFTTDNEGLGMNIMRIRLASNSSEWPAVVSSALKAQEYGAKIIASPWSPPAGMKSNGSTTGGYLPEENYGAFKDYINEFIAFMAQRGVNIYAVSVQNEPDIEVSYESCDWTASAMVDFIKNYGDLIEGAKLMAPESYNFSQSFTNILLGDANAANSFDVVAGHIYGGGLGRFITAEQQGKEIWMTEYLMNLGTGSTGAKPWSDYSEADKWEETMTALETVHSSMINNWNAYVWWYIQRYYSFIGDGEFGEEAGKILKRGYAFSHYSRYVKPGYVRIGQSSDKTTALKITAYEGDNKIVLVVINPEPDTGKDLYYLTFEVPSATSAMAYQTTLEVNQAQKPVELSEDKVILKGLSPNSITTVIINK